MNEPHDLNVTADLPASSAPPDSLEAGMAAGFGQPAAPRSSLGHLRPVLLKEAEGEDSHVVKPKSDAVPPRHETGDRYQLSGEIARGGMGAVLRGRDVDLGRDLAVKVLLPKYADRPEVARRFVEEAQIGGQLQHPGVVPVYDIGRFGDRPFFTMKLVKGQTLAHILSERDGHADDRPRLLGIALKVSETLAYAHAKGVIHRDLKPANVMVGAFGEVQVMDWGLAKVLAEGGIADEEQAVRAHQEAEDVTAIRTARSSGSAGTFGTETEVGSLLGTPAYMPPEQANGDVATLDRRADVFGLGAILCEILTGKPPYVGRAGEEVRRKAANGDLADATARLDACGADAELIALVKSCLAPEVVDRPKDAQAVADGLSAYLNGVQERLQAAERERAVAVVREAEQRKKRKVQLALAGAVSLLLLGGGAVGWWQSEQTAGRRLADERAAAERAQRQLEDERRAAADAARLGRNAEAVAALLGQAEEALRAGEAAKAAVALEAAAKRSAEGGAEKDAGRLGRLEADLTLLRDLDAVDQFRWTVVDNKLPDAAAITTRFREALRRFGADPDAVPAGEAATKVSASVVRGRVVAALDLLLGFEKRAGVRDLLRRLDPDDYRNAMRDAVVARDWAKFTALADRKEATAQPPGFTAFLGMAGMIPEERQREFLRSAVRRRPGDISLLMTLSTHLLSGGKEDTEERLRWCQAAVSVAPENIAAQTNLGIVLSNKGDLDGALACHRRAVELGPELASAHYNLGVALTNKGQVDGALACYRRAIELDPKLAPAHTNLGALLRKQKDLDGAVAAFRKAVELDPTGAGNHHNLGLTLAQKWDLDGALAAFRKAVELDPKNAQAHNSLSIALGIKGDLEGAAASLRKAVELDPKNARMHFDLGDTLRDKGDLGGALASYRKALELDPRHVEAHFKLGITLAHTRDTDGAIAAFRKAVELDPGHAKAHNSLGIELANKGDTDAALASFRKAAELDPSDARAHTNLGRALHAKGDQDGAIASFRRATKLEPKSASLHNSLGVALAEKGDLDAALASFRKAAELDPSHAKTQANLGGALMRKGDLDGAIACYRKALELDPKLAPIRPDLAKVERLIAAGTKLPAFLKGGYTPGSNAERLDQAEWCHMKKLHHAGALVFAAAFAADPQLADDLRASHRYNAACFAALAAAGQGDDAAKLDDKEKARLRKQALDWLRAELALRTKQLESGRSADRAMVQPMLHHWRTDPDLAGIRDKEALAKLPAEEQKAFAQLWADVAVVLKAAATQGKSDPPSGMQPADPAPPPTEKK